MTLYQTVGVCLATMFAWRVTLRFLVGVAHDLHEQFHAAEGGSQAIGFQIPQDPDEEQD